MSKVDIKIDPDLWREDQEGVLVTWLFSPGARVEAGAVVAEVMLEKVEMEVTAPASGALNILVETDGVVAANTVLGQIEVDA